MQGFWTVFAIALAGALASPLGGAVAIWKKPTTLLLSIAVGFAGGVLLATFAFEMLPEALALAALPLTVAGFAGGFAALYLLDLFVHRGASAGPDADQRAWVMRRKQRRRDRGDDVTVLAGGTSVEELIEGVVIGASAVADPALGMMVGLAIVVDNVAEALSIGELVRGATEIGRGGESSAGPASLVCRCSSPRWPAGFCSAAFRIGR
jgi:zinc transporter, ZIP family